MTTLEEVFLRLEEMEVDDKESDSETKEDEKKRHKKAYGSLGDPSRKDDDDDEDDSNDDVSATSGENVALLGSKSVVRGWALNWQQFKAFSWIRFILMLRNPAAVIFRVLLPPILIVIAVVVSRSLSSSTTESIRLPLNSSLYLSNATSRTFSHHCDNYPPLKPPLLLNNESNSYPDLLDQLTNLSTAYCFPGVDFNGDELDTYLLDHPYHALAIEVSDGGNPAEYSTFYNDTLIHSLPVGINLINSALYRNATQSSNGISVASYPFPSKNPQLPFDPNSYTVILIVGIAFLLIPSGFGIDVVLDREVSKYINIYLFIYLDFLLGACASSIARVWFASFHLLAIDDSDSFDYLSNSRSRHARSCTRVGSEVAATDTGTRSSGHRSSALFTCSVPLCLHIVVSVQ